MFHDIFLLWFIPVICFTINVSNIYSSSDIILSYVSRYKFHHIFFLWYNPVICFTIYSCSDLFLSYVSAEPLYKVGVWCQQKEGKSSSIHHWHSPFGPFPSTPIHCKIVSETKFFWGYHSPSWFRLDVASEWRD